MPRFILYILFCVLIIIKKLIRFSIDDMQQLYYCLSILHCDLFIYFSITSSIEQFCLTILKQFINY